jgi:hypothetical protein
MQSAPREEPAPPVPVRTREAPPPRPASRPAPAPPRTPAEQLVLAVLVLGLALNALVLLRHAALSRADVLLGTTVLVAGGALLVLLEVYRRTGS